MTAGTVRVPVRPDATFRSIAVRLNCTSGPGVLLCAARRRRLASRSVPDRGGHCVSCVVCLVNVRGLRHSSGHAVVLVLVTYVFVNNVIV